MIMGDVFVNEKYICHSFVKIYQFYPTFTFHLFIFNLYLVIAN